MNSLAEVVVDVAVFETLLVRSVICMFVKLISANSLLRFELPERRQHPLAEGAVKVRELDDRHRRRRLGKNHLDAPALDNRSRWPLT